MIFLINPGERVAKKRKKAKRHGARPAARKKAVKRNPPAKRKASRAKRPSAAQMAARARFAAAARAGTLRKGKHLSGVKTPRRTVKVNARPKQGGPVARKKHKKSPGHRGSMGGTRKHKKRGGFRRNPPMGAMTRSLGDVAMMTGVALAANIGTRKIAAMIPGGGDTPTATVRAIKQALVVAAAVYFGQKYAKKYATAIGIGAGLVPASTMLSATDFGKKLGMGRYLVKPAGNGMGAYQSWPRKDQPAPMIGAGRRTMGRYDRTAAKAVYYN